MPSLEDFRHRPRYHWVTGSIAQALEVQGAVAPHRPGPYSEAVLTGVCGAAAFGYFFFHYEGHDPQVNLLTRNTFHSYGWDAVVERLHIAQDVQQSTSADKARGKLIEAIETGCVPIVWADVYSLGYERSDFGPDMWMVVPLVVVSYDEGGEAVLADRSGAPIRVGADELDAARGRIKKERFRMTVLDAPDAERLPAAVAEGIRDCVDLYTKKPPKGSGGNFGLRAYERLVEVLTGPDSKTGWGRLLPGGRELHAALMTAASSGLLSCKADLVEHGMATGERTLHGAFFKEAAEIAADAGPGLFADGAPERLRLVSTAFAQAASLWARLGEALLPDEPGLLGRTRELLFRRHALFLEQANAAADQFATLDAELDDLRARAETELPSGTEAGAIFSGIADVVSAVAAQEKKAVDLLEGVLPPS